jgi:hypothetical protein
MGMEPQPLHNGMVCSQAVNQAFSQLSKSGSTRAMVTGSGLEISKGGLSNTYKKCISRADFALLMLTLSINKAPSFLLYLYLRYLHINYPITYVYLRFLTTLLRFFYYFT